LIYRLKIDDFAIKLIKLIHIKKIIAKKIIFKKFIFFNLRLFVSL